MWTFFVTCVEEAESVSGVSYPHLALAMVLSMRHHPNNMNKLMKNHLIRIMKVGKTMAIQMMSSTSSL